MKLTITKEQLKSLQECRGKQNIDNGLVFVSVVGRATIDDNGVPMFDLEYTERARLPDEETPPFSLKSILQPAKATPPKAIPATPAEPATPAKSEAKGSK